MKPRVEIQYALDDDRTRLPHAAHLARWAQAACAAAGRRFEREPQMTLRLVEEAEIVRLNSVYRHKTAPTNVLSFPFEPPAGLPREACPAELGDVVICAAVVRREAAEQGKSEESHWAHMVVHGTLHLLGYDHVTAAEAARMEPLEVRVLAALGHADPYAVAERADAGQATNRGQTG